MEPNVPDVNHQLNAVLNLVEMGFPLGMITLRVDPIIPTEKGLRVAAGVIRKALEMGILPVARCRISIMDEYRHVKKRFADVGLKQVYPGDRGFPLRHELDAIIGMLAELSVVFETCAEPYIQEGQYGKATVIHSGCVGPKDVELMGLAGKPGADAQPSNPYARNGCLCLPCKRELLDGKHERCPHGCLYYYWWGANANNERIEEGALRENEPR